MVKKIIAAAIVVIGFSAFRFIDKPLSLVKSIQQNFSKITDSLYASKYETTNAEYREFLIELQTSQPTLYLKYYFDSTKWSTLSIYSTPMQQYYHRHPAYNNYPAVCINYEASVAYCEWLTRKYNSDPKRKFNKVEFILPSEEQWMSVAMGGSKNKNKLYPWGGFYLRNRTGQFLCNFKHMGDESITYNAATREYEIVPEFQGAAGGLNDRSMYTAEVTAFQPAAPYSIHNMCGNVAEMISEKGIAKGGSYNSTGYDVRIQSKMNYKEASPEIGFRVFMKILEN